MLFQKFSALLNEIVTNYPDNLSSYLEQKLQIPDYKAKELAQRLEDNFKLKLNHEIRKKIDECSTQPEILTRKNENNFNIYSLDSISRKDFEQFLKWLFEELGYIVRLTSLTADSGVDLIIEKEKDKIAVQAKRFKRTNKVPNSVILKTRGVQEIHGCSRAMIVTTSFFTNQAIKEAKQLDIELWDRNYLSVKIDQINSEIIGSKNNSVFPPYTKSLLHALLNLDKMGIFHIKRLKNEVHHIYRHGLNCPLITFKTDGIQIKKLVFRISDNTPVPVSKGEELIFSDSHHTYGPYGTAAYEQIQKYLSQFMNGQEKNENNQIERTCS